MAKQDAVLNRLTPALLEELRRIVGAGNLITAGPDLEPYTHDFTEDLVRVPEAAVRPGSAEEVAAVIRLAARERIPITPRGGGTGLSGGALAARGGIVLSLDRMDRIIEIDEANLCAVVEAGVITEVLQKAVEEQGLFYPPDPSSKGSCRIGGNIAHNAGGPRAVKYGVTRDWVLGLEAVLPTGETIRCGGKLRKNVTGFDLTRLIVGSEGTLAVVTRATLRLIPWPPHRRTLLASFDSVKAAAEALVAIYGARVLPSAAEFLTREAMKAAEAKLGRPFPQSDSAAALLLEVDGHHGDEVDRATGAIGEVLAGRGVEDVILADASAKQKELWDLRRCVGEAVKSLSIYKEEDTVVPPARLPELMEAVDRVVKRHGLTAVSYGHAGDGNIHVNILRRELDDEAWGTRLPVAIRELFREVVALGGTITGEHGVGLVQKDYLPIALGPAEIALMRRLKEAFDPHGIMNPGKVFPDDYP